MFAAFSGSTDANLQITVLLTLSLGLIVWGVRDCMRYPQSQWELIDRSRRKWIMLQLAFGPPAVFLYAAAVRFDLKDPERVAYVGDKR